MTQPLSPTTQAGQLAALFAALKVTDFAAAMASIGNFDAAGNWQNDQKALFEALGAKDQAGAITAITSLKEVKPPVAAAPDDTEKMALWTALGATDQGSAITAITTLKTTGSNFSTLLSVCGVTDFNAAIVAIGNMKTAQTQQAEIFTALKVNDHAGAMTAVTDVEGRIHEGVKTRAASAGLTEPAPKGAANAEADQPGGAQRAVTPRSRLAASINTQVTK